LISDFGASASDCLLQRRTEEFRGYSLFSRHDSEKLIYWSGTKNVQEQWLNVALFLDPWQGNLTRGGRMMRIIENGQPRSRLRLGINSQQYLVRELIAGRCSGLPKGNVKDIAVGIVGDTGWSHQFSPPLSENLVSRHNEVVLRAIRRDAETNHDNNSGIA